VWILVEEPPRLGDEPGKTPEAPRDWEKPYTRDAAVLRFSPRGTGNAAWRSPHPYHIERALAIVGRTPDSGRVRDIALTAAMLRQRSNETNPVRLIGRGTAGVLALYAALLEPSIEEVVAVSPPASHHEGPHFLGILRVCDIPEAMGALAPRKLTLSSAPRELATKVQAIYTAAGAREHLIVR
jgi:pimeloyl-ACP methyl ester carboxylesterase